MHERKCQGLPLALHVSLTSSKGTVSVGPGARWGEVFTEVEQYGMSVDGGRVATVGVPGLLLGGGMFQLHSRMRP